MVKALGFRLDVIPGRAGKVRETLAAEAPVSTDASYFSHTVGSLWSLQTLACCLGPCTSALCPVTISKVQETHIHLVLESRIDGKNTVWMPYGSELEFQLCCLFTE